ncbi:MAG: ABC transporter permease [Cyclobacteriaceae bacterium]
MLKNYIKTAIRHLKRQPAYTALNVVGLTIGIASSLLIIIYLTNELSFDKYHQNADRVYRISSDITEPDNAFRWAVTQIPLGQKVKSEFSEVVQYTRFISNGRTRFDYNNIAYYQEDIFFVDSTIFELFTYEILSGNPETALDAPNKIMLSKSVADMIFKGQNPIGEIIKTDDMSLEVTGIYADTPEASHIRPTGLISASSTSRSTSQNWGGFGIYTYIKLDENVVASGVETKLNEIIEAHVAPIFDRFNINVEYELINIQDIHLQSTFTGEPEPLGDLKYIYIFSIIGVFLIVIASINYMNLATARSMRRSLEVGVRKVLGAQRNSLIGQFMMESLVISFLSLLISFIIVLIAVPILNNQLQLNLSALALFKPILLLLVFAVVFVTGILSGSYPALYLSGFTPAVVLKGGKSSKSGGKITRSILVGLQFSISIFMLVGTFIINSQMNFLRESDLGFEKDKVMRIVLDSPAAREKFNVLKSKVESVAGVANVASATTSPGRGYGKNVMSAEMNNGVMEQYGIDSYGVDYSFFSTLKIPIIEGRDISPKYPTDTASAVLVNEAMVTRMNWENPIGKKFQFDRDSTKFHRVVGVVKNFHQRSLYDPIEALLFIPSLNNSDVLVKIDGDLKSTMSSIENQWNDVFPGSPFEPEFIDENFMKLYEEDQLRGKLFLGFSIMMIIIGCLGLLGLASFIAEQRTKEISIRKVLGASLNGLVSLIIKDFLWLVVFGAIPGFLLAYYFMNEWLANFQYHIELGFVPFLSALILVLILTTLTTGYHAFKAANSNPSDNLKYE